MQILKWFAAIAIVTASTQIAQGEAQSPAGNSQKARALFTHPSAEYSSAPFWVWNDMMTDEMVISTLHDLYSQGIRQVFIHPRPGLMTPYLSDEWFRLWKLALDEAKRLGMIVWIYDENSYPSGFAGGFVPELMPESRGMGLTIQKEKLSPKWSADIVGVFRPIPDGYENITEKIKSGELNDVPDCLVARIKQADKSGWYADRTYVNLISKGVTEKFLEVTLDPYKKHFGDEFGRQIPGSFTDEPHILPAGQMPWANDLPEVFEKRWGYSIIENLPSLAKPVGDFKRVRHNYYATLLELFIDRWAKPYYEYCEKNNLEFTGHYWEHQWPGCRQVPDNMAMSAWQHRPGIDILFNQYSENVNAQFGNIRSVKEIASLANQLDRKRTLCEAYGGAGWDLRFEDMKRIGDWMTVLGINTINQHLSFVSIRGARKADYPQSFSYHEPWWDGYHVLVEYFARLSAAISQGEQINKVLVIEPTSTAWLYQFDPNQSKQLEKIGAEFQRLVVLLAKQQVEFDIGCEDVIARYGSVEATSLKVGKRDYDVIVLPPLMENINTKTMDLLSQFTAAGGHVLCCGQLPSLVDGNQSNQPEILAKGAGFKQVSTADLPSILLEKSNNSFSIQLDNDNNGILLHQRRKLDDGELLFLTNTSLNSPCKGVIESPCLGIEQWDAESGAISPFAFDKTQRGVKAQFELAPAGSLLLFLANKPIEPAKNVIVAESPVKPAGQMKIKRAAPNVLTLDYLDLTLGDKTTPNIYYNRAAKMVFAKYGFNDNPWDHGVQFQDEIIKRTFAPDSGFEATYRFTIKGRAPKPLFVVIERPESFAITCNGKSIKPKSGQWWLDKSFAKIDISSCAKTGENKLTIKVRPFTIYDEIAAVYVLGNFKLEPNDSGFVITKDEPMQLGPWNKQGYPFYGDGVSYKQNFKVADKNAKYLVRLKNWYGSTAKVVVNGKDAGFIWHQPWDCDVSSQIKKGDNQIEVIVIGSLKNTLGLHHSGQPGQVGPSAFREAPSAGPAAGAKYRNIAYGLYEPFELIRH
jgi:hypothetical protein